MNLNNEQELDREIEPPYEVHKYRLTDLQYITFMAPPTKRFKIEVDIPAEDEQGNWRYKAQWINGFVWVFVEVGVLGTKKMWKHPTDNVRLLKREKDVRIKFAEDWDKIYQVARNTLGV